MRTLSMTLKSLLSNKVLMGIFYVAMVIVLVGLLVYALLVDHELVFNILFGLVVFGMWFILSVILLVGGFEAFMHEGIDAKSTGLLIGFLGVLSLGSLIAAFIYLVT